MNLPEDSLSVETEELNLLLEFLLQLQNVIFITRTLGTGFYEIWDLQKAT